MIRQETHLQQMLTQLRTRLLVMCAATGIALDDACEALRTGNVGRASAVVEGDAAIDELENEIDAMALSLMVRAQPVAHDLRFVVGTLRMVVDLERIGDEAASIAERAILMQGLTPLPVMEAVLGLMETAKTAYKDAVEAFRSNDIPKALKLCRMEDEMTQQEVVVLQHIMESVCSREQADLPYTTMHSILICRALNRISRRSANIAEHAYFIANGVSIKHKRPQAD